MNDPAVFSFLSQTLCSHGGRLGLRELQEYVGLSAPQLQDTLSAAGPRRFLVVEGGTEVLAVTDVRVCVLKECHGCERLHLCKLHLMGRCHLRPSPAGGAAPAPVSREERAIITSDTAAGDPCSGRTRVLLSLCR